MDWNAVRRAVLGVLVAFGLAIAIVSTTSVPAALAQDGEITEDPGWDYGWFDEGPPFDSDPWWCAYFGVMCPEPLDY
jgi:hypothetical protein